jgi:hypothetical protein
MANENANDILDGVADDIMPEVGFSAILRKVENNVLIDPNDPSKGYTTVTTDYPVEVFEYDPEQKDIDGTLVQKNDKYVLVSIKDIGVTVTNTFLYDNGAFVWNIMSVLYVPVGDTNATLIIQVRK